MRRRDSGPSNSERLEAKIRALMAELATYPASGPTAWQFREGRRRLAEQIEHHFQARDVALEFEGLESSLFDGELA